MNKGKAFFICTLIAVATFAGVTFVNARGRGKGAISYEQVPTKENSINNPVGINKNNPGNIRDSLDVFQGEIDSPNSPFKSFASMAEGFRAMIVILRTYYNRYNLHTLSEMISRWAPPNENDTQGYINYVAVNAPIDPSMDLHSVLFSGYNDDAVNILRMMSLMEQGESFTFNEDDIRQAFNLLV